MTINWNEIPETAMEHFKGGEGTTYARMFFDGKVRVMLGRLPAGATIGMHTHETNSEVFQVVSGTARVILDGVEEIIPAGQSHYCPKGHAHTTLNDGPEDLILFAVVPEQ